MHERLRDTMLGAWGRFVASRPVPVLVACVALGVAAITLTALRLEFRAYRSELVDPELRWNRLYTRYKDHFDRWDDAIVCIEGPAGDDGVDDLARRIAERLRADDRVIAADAGFSVSEAGPRLFAVAPEPVFTETLERLLSARRIVLAGNANEALLDGLADARQAGEAQDAAALDDLERFLAPYLAALEGEPADFSFLRPDAPRWQALVSARGSGRLRFIRVQLAETSGGIDRSADDLRWLRGRIAELIGEPGSPLRDGLGSRDVAWGVTGIPAIETDETEQSIRDSTVASIVALVLITALMIAVFRGVVVPLLAAGSLLIGLSWSFAWLIISVGHLQLLSVVFSVILLGLGIDFALHLVARLELVQDEHPDLPSATARVFRGIGPGLVTGAVTTAAAFGATALTDFTGMAEMGVIAGGGILLCMVAVLTSFPAALALTGRWKDIIRHRPGGERVHFAGGRLDTIDFHAKGSLATALVVVVLLAVPALRVEYDPNVLRLHPPGIESVRWEKRIVEDDAGSVWSAVIETAAGTAPALADRLRALPQVSGVGAMGLLLPPDRDERAARIADILARPLATAPAEPGLEPLRRQLAAVRAGLLGQAPSAGSADAERLRRIAARIERALAASARLDPPQAAARFASLDASFGAARAVLADWTDAALAPVPPSLDDLPAMLREQWSHGDTWLLEVLPVHDAQGRSILDPGRLRSFVEALQRVAPNVTGPAVQIHESSKLIKREYIKAAVFAVAAILVLLLLDFRSLADALCSMLPVSIGFIGTFGLMGLLGVPLNFANIIVLPLIFGIGVDAGVHMVHRWRAEPYGRPAGLSGGTGRGITLTMASTMIGFGCMLLAEHRGIRSLGFVMLTGLGVCLLACYTVLPPVLRLRTLHWATEEATTQRST
jgi:hypothetical protein